MPDRTPHAVVVGGSLSGLCAGLALVRAGWTVTIAERADGEPPGGAGLGLDRRLLDQVTGVDASRIPVVNGNRDSAAWGLVRQFLLGVALRTAGIEFLESTTVSSVREPVEAGRVTVDSTGGALTADVVVGADGAYSATRRFVAPDHPAARYAGYMLWRGLVPEAEIPGGLDGHGQNLEIHGAPGARLVVYGVPGAGGRTDPGRRRVSFAWYDASRTGLLRQTGCLHGDAAHVATPMTGAGFRNALLDVAALAGGLRGMSGGDVPVVLGRYERERPPLVRRLVSSGMAWGRSCLSAEGAV